MKNTKVGAAAKRVAGAVRGRGVAALVMAGAVVVGGASLSSAAPIDPLNGSRQATASIPNTKGAVTNWHLGKGVVYADNFGPGMAQWFLTTPENTIEGRHVKNGTLPESKLDAATRAKLNKTGPAYAAHWGTVNRNVIGNARAELATVSTEAPSGDGALQIDVPAATDKAAFGNEIDFARRTLDTLTKVGYTVYTTGENAAFGPNNMPSITFEINPRIEGSTRTYSSMVFAPNNSAPNSWTAIDATSDAQGKVWGLTGADMPCNINGARCTWSELMDALDDGGDKAEILSAQVTKGRDFPFHGAVDKLVIGNQTYDFEAGGVLIK